MDILRGAASLRSACPDVRFQFYSSDATDILEHLERGSLDFVIVLQPVDTMKYNYITLPETSRWGMLMPEKLGDGLCFRPLEPPLEPRYALIWKRYAVFSRAAEAFLARVKALL